MFFVASKKICVNSQRMPQQPVPAKLPDSRLQTHVPIVILGVILV
jgi:hypothetical protein